MSQHYREQKIRIVQVTIEFSKYFLAFLRQCVQCMTMALRVPRHKIFCWATLNIQQSTINRPPCNRHTKSHTASSIYPYSSDAVIMGHFYTWDAVTSVNLTISMVKYLRRHLVCTTDCLHEQEWWILMR